MTDKPQTPPASGGVILLPSDRFFVRVVPLAAGADIVAQVALALESLSPFPVSQLFHGYLVAPARDTALVFAAYRKRFSAEEISHWNKAATVLPVFLSLLGDAPTAPTVRLWAGDQGITAVAWNGRSPLPVAVIARETEQPANEALRSALVTEIRARAGLAVAPVQEFSGEATVSRNQSGEGWVLGVKGGARSVAFVLGRGEIQTADVRDKEFLTSQRSLLKRDLLLWRGFLGCAAGLAAMLVLEGGLLGVNAWLKGTKDLVQQQAVAVKKIETAQSLSVRIEEMTQRRLKPLEMLALINQNRPASIQFIRANSAGLYTMEVEAQTANAADVSQYEAALRTAPEFAGIETRDLRSREGVTTFVLTVIFKPESLRQGAGS